MSTQDKTKPKPAEQVMDLLPFLSGIDKGGLVREGGARLQELVAAMRETGKGGSITLRIDVKPTTSTPGQSATVTATGAVTAKLPALPKRQSVFFIDTNDNTLSRTPTDPDLFSTND